MNTNKAYTKRKVLLQGNNVIDTTPFGSSTTTTTTTTTKSIFEKDDEEENETKTTATTTTITEAEPSPKKIKQWDWRSASTALYSPSPSKKETKKSSTSKGLKGKIGGEGKEKKQQLEQLFLDLGQRNFGPIICDACKMMYTPGVKEDDDAHTKYHSKHKKIVDFSNWRACKIAKEFPTKGEGIVVVVKTDPSSQWKKALEVRAMMDKELGWVDSSSSSINNSVDRVDQKVFMYVNKSKKVVGCVVAERISEAFRVIEEKLTVEKDNEKDTSFEQEGDSNGSDGQKPEGESEGKEKSDKNSENKSEKKDKDGDDKKSEVDKKQQQQQQQHSDFTVKCSKIPTPAVCGISRIWVLDSERRKGIATKLLDCVCKNMIYGFCVPKDGLAFSQPTADGNRFFSKYTGRKDYLVYL